MKRSFLIKLFTIVLALVLLTGCVGKTGVPATDTTTDTTTDTEKTSTETAAKDETSSGTETVVVWTCNTGNTGEWLTEAASRFNESQSKYIIQQEYAGSYQEVLAKLVASKPGDLPDVFHSDTEGSYTYVNKKDMFVPIQKYIDQDNYDMSSFMGNLKATYTINGEWQCMPLGNTVTGFWYNTELLSEAGINPDTDLNSYQEIVEACRKLKNIGVEKPFYLHASSGFYTFPMTAQGIQYVNNNNGKDGIPTKSLISEGACYDATVDFFQVIKDMKAEDLMVPFGTTVADARDMFVNEETAIMCAFISSFNTVKNAVNGKFEFGFHVAPTITAGTQNVGQCTGGGALFIANNGNEAKERGAWEFMKFLMTDENTSGYAMASGYLPTTESGFNTPQYQEFVKTTFPTAANAIAAQRATPSSCFNAWLPMFNDFHALCREYYALAYDNDSLTAEEITLRFAEAVDECIELFNLQN